MGRNRARNKRRLGEGLQKILEKAFQSIGDMFKKYLAYIHLLQFSLVSEPMIMEGLKNGITGANIWDGIKHVYNNYR